MKSERRSGKRQRWRRTRFALVFTVPALALGLCVALLVTDGSPPQPFRTAADISTATTPPNQAPQADLALKHPVDPAGNAISLHQTWAQAANSLNCTLTVPAYPLTPSGLASPWVLGDGCSEANPDEEAFVEATILAPDGEVQVYAPLVVSWGTRPAVKPTPPTIPSGSVVVIDTGFNGNNLVLEGQGAYQGRCVDALGDSIIAQTAACDFGPFYQQANKEIAAGTLKVPALGTGSDGKPCESTESFSLIDQDQSDNVVSQYLLKGNGQTAQVTAANMKTMRGATVIANGSDDGLLAHFVDVALGCTPYRATDATATSETESSQALDALSARQDQTNAPALLPVNDPQLLVDGQFSLGKVNIYRAMVDQPALSARQNRNWNAATYCQYMVNTAPARLKLDHAKEVRFTSPVPATGDNLATFMGARLAASFTNLSCQDFGLRDPVTVTVDGNGVATAVSYRIFQQVAKVPPRMGSAGPGGKGYNSQVPTRRRRNKHHENGAGM